MTETNETKRDKLIQDSIDLIGGIRADGASSVANHILKCLTIALIARSDEDEEELTDAVFGVSSERAEDILLSYWRSK